ncbi:hypothetical protein AB3S75_047978 [Citrus x aurantiifolia]
MVSEPRLSYLKALVASSPSAPLPHHAPFWAQGSTSGTNRQVLTPPSVRTKLDSVCTRVLSPNRGRVGQEFMG